MRDLDLAPSQASSYTASPTRGGLGQIWREVLPALILGVIAAGFRLYRLPSVPPGLHHDEAVNGLDVLYTIPQLRPIFFELNNGREPLFIYLQALAVQLLGPTALALRLTSAVVGILTVLATCWLAREWFGHRVAVLAGLGLATSLWHVTLSRVGLRAIAAPLFLTLALAYLWRGLRKGELASFALSGLAIGLGLYTYISARLVPCLVLAICAWEVARGGRDVLRRWAGLLVLVAVAAAVAAPLGAYFAEHPDTFLGRSEQVSILNPKPTIEGEPDTFGKNLKNTLGMFSVQGDANPRHNLPGRPVFDHVAAPWLAIGLGVALWQAGAALTRRRRTKGLGHGPGGPPEPRAAQAARVAADASPQAARPVRGQVPPAWRPEPAGWLLTWLVGTLALGALTHESPNYLRLTLMAPAVYVTWGLGLAAAWRWLGRRTFGTPGLSGALAGLLVVALLVYEGGRTYRDYFEDWASRTEVYHAFDAGLTAAARYVESAEPDLPLFLYVDRSPPVLFLSPATRQARWLQEYTSLLLLPRAHEPGAVYVFAGDGSVSRSPWLYLPGLRPDGLALDPAGREAFTAYHLSPAQVESLASPAVPLSVVFGDAGGGVELLGYSLDSATAGPGERAGVTLLWRQRGNAETVYAPYLHVLDQAGRSWGQDDRLGFAVGGWRDGDLLLSRHEWAVPPDAPPLTYRLAVGMAAREFGWPPGAPKALGPRVDLAWVRVDRPGAVAPGEPLPPVGTRLDADVGAGLRLVGYDAPARTLKPGDRTSVDLLWQALEAPSADAIIELSLASDAGRVWVLSADRPVYGECPTTRWPPGTILRDPRTLTLPGDIPSGRLHLQLRALDSATGRTLGQATLGVVEVVEPSRSYELPPMQRRLNANFGEEIALRGFDLDRDALPPEGTLRLTLYWQALRVPTRSYTVFTHLLDSANHVVAQQDNPPVRGDAPTLGWVPGQVVRDEFELNLRGAPTSGEVLLEVGLYDATTGERLRLVGGDEDTRVVLAHLPIVSEE